jgi:hypothetical protein
MNKNVTGSSDSISDKHELLSVNHNEASQAQGLFLDADSLNGRATPRMYSLGNILLSGNPITARKFVFLSCMIKNNKQQRIKFK